ncbi:LA_2272 family surface repeat-containing protein [Flavobacterium hauense]
MRTLISILMLLMATACLSQQNADSLHSQIFSFTPLPKKVNKVNGLALGIGQMFDEDKSATINGLNIEVNPLIILAIGFLDPDKVPNNSINQRYNGLHLSTMGFMGGVAHNGVGISVLSHTYSSNGLSITGFYNISKNLNGLYIAGITNSTDKAAGLLIAPVNSADVFRGFQLGIYNKSNDMAGLQIGLYNRTKNAKGLQIGLWNTNNKRSLPFINWNFKN